YDGDLIDLPRLTAQLDAAAAAPPADDTIAVCDGVLAEIDAASPEGRLVAARARFEKARGLSRLGRLTEARLAVAELVRHHEHDADPAARGLVCRALFGQAKDRLGEGAADRRVVIVDYRHVLHIAERLPPIDAFAAMALYHLALTHGKIAVERANTK